MDMMNWMEVLTQNQIQTVIDMNQKTERFGLVLTKEDAKLLVDARRKVLQEQQRVEFGEGILPGLIWEFCDSAYISRDDYVEIIMRLQEIFFEYKNETLNRIPDDELIKLMKELYEEICFGDLDYLEGTCLNRLARVIRTGGREAEKRFMEEKEKWITAWKNYSP